MARGEYLLEVRAEEIPARMLAPAMAELAERVGAGLAAKDLPAEIETAYTPRRLVLVARGLADREPDREERVVGPPAAVAFDGEGEPTKAALGFAARCGVAPGALERVATDKGEYVAAVVRTAGRPTAEVLAELMPRALAGLSWAKTMRWGAGHGPWVRPVHGILSLLAGEVVPFTLFGVAAGAETTGHAVHSPEPFAVKSFADYRRKLARRGVEVAPAVRRETLRKAMTAAAADLGGELVEDAALLDKLAAICEVPGVMVGGFDEAFLALPREVLITSLRDHQSALTVEEPAAAGAEPDGEAGGDRPLLPHFLTVMDRADDPEGRVRAGNEWVVAARLADARFFFAEDRKVPLGERAGRLAQLGFHERLGSYADKSERIVALTRLLIEALDGEADLDDALTAARLLKADLTAEMVKEFTSLQGVIGGLYAREEGMPEAVWQAIYDQYLPASADDPDPPRAGGPGDRAGRPDRHPGRHLRPRPGAHRQPRPVRAPPRRPGGGAHRAGGRSPARPRPGGGAGGAVLRRPADPLGRPAAGDPPPLPLRPRPLPARPARLRLRRDRGGAGGGGEQPARPGGPGRRRPPAARPRRASCRWCWPPSGSSTSSRTIPSIRSKRRRWRSRPSGPSTAPSRS